MNIKKYDRLKYYNADTIIRKFVKGLDEKYEGWNFNSGNYLFTTDTK